MPRRAKSVGISHISPELIAKGKAKAARLHMSFSGYVVSLIERDLEDSERFPSKTNQGSIMEDSPHKPSSKKVADVANEIVGQLGHQITRRRRRKGSKPPRSKGEGPTPDAPPDSSF